MRDVFSRYRKEVGELHLTDEEKDRIAERIDARLDEEENLGEARKVGASKTRRPPLHAIRGRNNSLRRAAAAIVVLSVLMASTAAVHAATGGKPAVSAIEDVFYGAPADTEIVGDIGKPVGASSTDAGIRITCDSLLGDANNVAVIYTLEREDGASLESIAQKNADGKYPISFIGSSGVEVDGVEAEEGAGYFYDSEPGDGKIQYVQLQHLRTQDGDSLVGKSARVTLQGLQAVNSEDDGATHLLASGTWSFRFKLAYRDTTSVYTCNKRASFGEKEILVEQVRVSPLAIEVVYSGNYDWVELRDIPISVQYRDGDSWQAESFSVHSKKGSDEYTLTKSFFLDRVVGEEAISSVTIGGLTLDLR